MEIKFLSAFTVIIAVIVHNGKCEYCYYREGKELDDSRLDCEYFSRNEPIEGISLIHLKHNTTIPVIKKGLLSPFKNLKTLYITAANVESIEGGAFDNFKLEMIDLYHNNIKAIENGTFRALGSLKYLDLSYNKFEVLKENTFEGLTALEWLSLSSNLLKSIDVAVFNDLKRLKSLYLAFNQISHLDNKIFKKLTSLELLDLSFNSLVSVPADLFTNQVHLQYLWLKHNALKKLPNDIFEKTTEIKMLDISQNEIAELHETLFYNTKQLKSLRFSSNQISELNSTSLLGHAPYLEEIHLHYNHWKCDDLKNVTRDFMEHHVHVATATPVKLTNVGGIDCNE